METHVCTRIRRISVDHFTSTDTSRNAYFIMYDLTSYVGRSWWHDPVAWSARSPSQTPKHGQSFTFLKFVLLQSVNVGSSKVLEHTFMLFPKARVNTGCWACRAKSLAVLWGVKSAGGIITVWWWARFTPRACFWFFWSDNEFGAVTIHWGWVIYFMLEFPSTIAVTCFAWIESHCFFTIVFEHQVVSDFWCFCGTFFLTMFFRINSHCQHFPGFCFSSEPDFCVSGLIGEVRGTIFGDSCAR